MADVERPVALVKLDCEGSEYDIILHSRADSWRSVQRVVLEYHPVKGVGPSALLKRLRQLGFELVGERQDAPALGVWWLSRRSDAP
jgi:hypothetical protein